MVADRKSVPPVDVVQQVMTKIVTDSRIPVIRMLVRSPVMLPDGSWADQDGYHDGLLIARRDVGYRVVPDVIDDDLVAASRGVIFETFAEVKFADREAGLAGLLGRAVGLAARP